MFRGRERKAPDGKNAMVSSAQSVAPKMTGGEREGEKRTETRERERDEKRENELVQSNKNDGLSLKLTARRMVVGSFWSKDGGEMKVKS